MFDKEDIYIIAEVGQNHQGNVETALEYVTHFSSVGANAVKFQMRNNKYLFSNEKYDAVYQSSNSFGSTYGEHRDFLELTFSEMSEVRDLCSQLSVDFICTPFDEPSIDVLDKLDVDAFKIASFDLGNIPFLEKVADVGKPVVMSTGGGNLQQVQDSVKVFQDRQLELALLHCVSKYPCPADELLLGRIPILAQHFPEAVPGSSDHFNGILSGPVAYMLGARVFEKHVTFDRSQKGTDHSFSLEKDGFRKFVRDLHRTKDMLKFELPNDVGKEPVFNRLGKSLVAAQSIHKSTVITKEMLTGKVFDQEGIPVRQSSHVIGTQLMKDIQAGEMLTYDHLKLEV